MIVVGASSSIERIHTIDLGLPLRLEEEIADFIAQENVNLHPGYRAVLYTDRIRETKDINGVPYGLERLIQVFRLYRQLSAT